MPTDGVAAWDARYAAADLVWSAGPSRWAVEVLGDLPPGVALDLGTGEGRHAVWLARRGWRVTAVDFSGEAIRKARALQEAHLPGAPIDWRQADVLADPPPRAAFDAVLLMYLHLPRAQHRTLLRAAARALAPGGTLLLAGHDLANLTAGRGGPQDPDVLFTAEDLVAHLEGLEGLDVVRAERAERPVGDAVALDTVLHVVRRV